jgi:DNA-binding NtrC family response regulator
LDELARTAQTEVPESVRKELASLFESDEYAAAEQAARWHVIFRGKLDSSWRNRADRVLRARGGEALARRVFGSEDGGESVGLATLAADLRNLREAVAGVLAGEERDASLAAFRLSGLALADSDSREILRFGRLEGPSKRRLDAGASSYELAVSPTPSGAVLDAIALILETLLFRHAPAEPPSDFAEGWRRLGVIAADTSMEEPYRRLVRLAPSPVTVLVRGESGSGKEAVARAVHALSPRARRAFVAVNVPAVPSALLESELFGHARGAFTGAERDRAGLLEEAEGGTIFFDEIGDLSAPLQAKLLRALQEREIRRVGENRSRRLDVRVVSATSRELEREVEAGRFREDLYYRLHVAVIALPPLRDRGRDVVLLARHFLERCSRDFSRGRLAFAPETLSILSTHSWPGNVRELQNVVSQAAALAAPGAVVGPDLLPEELRRRKAGNPDAGNYRARVDRHRRGLVCEALERAGGNRSKAARDLGLSRQALVYLIRELRVEPRSRTAPKL